MHDHPERIADKQKLAMWIEERGHGRRIGRQANDLLMPLARGNFRRGDTL